MNIDKKISNFDKTKKELVYYTTNHRDGGIIEAAIFCSELNYRLVLIIPTIKRYPYEINQCFHILGNDFLIYEINMGMYNVLASRARKYIEYIETAELYE